MKASTIFTMAAAALIAAAPIAGAGAQAPKKGGTLTYTYQPEPTALSTLATTAVPVALAATKIYDGLLEYAGPGLDPKPGCRPAVMRSRS